MIFLFSLSLSLILQRWAGVKLIGGGDAVHIDQDDHKLFQVKSLISLPFPSGYLRFLPSQDLDIMTWKTNVFSSLLIIFHVFPPPHTHTPMFKWTYLFIYSQINILLA